MRYAWLVLVMACRAAPEAKEPTGGAAAPSLTAELAVPAGEPVLQRAGSVSREELVAVLSKGPGEFLQTIEVASVLETGQFRGWRLVRFFPRRDASPIARADIRPGDTLWRVNGVVIERPEHLMAVWESLYAATQIHAELVRDGEPFELRFQIADGPTASAGAVAAPIP